MVRSTQFSTTTSPPRDFYLPPHSISTFSSTARALRELFSLYLEKHTSPKNDGYRYDHILAYLRSPPTTADHVATLPHAVQLHAATPVRLESLLALRDEAVYLDLQELAHLCNAELRRYPNFHLSQLARTPSHVLSHTRGPSSSSMRSMDTLREHDEDAAGVDADIGSTSTGRDSVGSAKSTGSVRGRGRSRSTSAAATAPVPLAREKEELSPHQAPPPLLHRRLASQSRERPEHIEVKSPSVRGRPSGTWL